ncbi:caspase family protein [Streptomyces sp. DSM 118878]
MTEHPTTPGQTGPRYVVVAGSAAYDHVADLPAVEEDLDTVLDAFGSLAYGRGARLLDCTSDELRSALSEWAEHQSHPDASMVFYYSGHGEFDDDNRHYLLGKNGHGRRLAATGLAAEDVVRIIGQAGIRRLLLIIDTCYAAQGAVDAIRQIASSLASSLTATRGAHPLTLDAFSVIATATPLEAAQDGAFARTLRSVLNDPALGGMRQPKLYLEQIVDRVNVILAGLVPPQTATWGTLPSGPGFTFLPNHRFQPNAPAIGTDLAEMAAWLLRTVSPPREERYVLSAGGVSANRQPEPFVRPFIGRRNALEELRRWTTGTSQSAAPALILTGPAGTGKTALLEHLAVGTPCAGNFTTAASPDTGFSIQASRQLLPSLVEAVAAAAKLADGTSLETLLEHLSHRHTSMTIVVDGLDEAGTPPDSEEPLRIIRELLKPLVGTERVRMLVATDEKFLPALKLAFPSAAHMDLTTGQWNAAKDMAVQVGQLLRSPDGPGATNSFTPLPDEDLAPLSQTIAQYAGGNFLVARLLARACAHVHGKAPEPRTALDEARQLLPAPSADGTLNVDVTVKHVLWKHLDQTDHGQGLLIPLAFAEGDGLPRYALWPRISSAVLGREVSHEHLTEYLQIASPHVIEAIDAQGRSVYRLAHESLALCLRKSAPANVQAAVTQALLSIAEEHRSNGGNGPIDWPTVDPYIKDHLATHAAACKALDALLIDPLFLLTADTNRLLRATRSAGSKNQHVAAAFCLYAEIRAAMPDHRSPAGWLAWCARRVGAHQLADETERRFPDHAQWVKPPHLDPAESHLIISCPEPLVYQIMSRPDGWQVVATTTSPGGFHVPYHIRGLRSGAAGNLAGEAHR